MKFVASLGCVIFWWFGDSFAQGNLQDTEDITALCVSQSSKYLLSFTSSLSLRIYELPSLPSHALGVIQPINVIGRAHDAPVHVCKVDPTSTYLASGSADGVVKIWDIAKGHITHVFKGHGGVVSALTFNFPRNPDSVVRDYRMQLVTASVDTRVRIFNLVSQGPDKNKPEAVLEGHVSVPRALDVTPDGKWLISSGRDSVALIWDLSSQAKSSDKKGKGKLVSPSLVTTVPILERVEAAGFLHTENESGKLLFYTAGEKGVIKIWDARQGKALHQIGRERLTVTDEEQEEQRQIIDASYHSPSSTIISVHADQNILFHSVTTHELTRQLIGYNDEIVDAAFLSSTPSNPDSHIAFATNSSLIRVYSISSLDSRLLEGHSEIVLSLDRSASKSLIASGSKDKTARLWAPLAGAGADTNNWGWGCVAVCEGHAESVGALAMSRTGGSFMFTGSQDRTIKMWDLSQVPEIWSGDDHTGEESSSSSVVRCQSLMTLKAHDKDINALDVAPNDRLLASGSQDRTAKVFEIVYHGGAASRGELKLLGTCKGHKRGVWTVRFGRAERVLATGGGDKTVRLWNLDDFTCVKTFEGHTNSVLRVDFISQGMQLISTASDGLVKLWNVHDEVCVATLDNHEDKVCLCFVILRISIILSTLL
jgi:U3 small nucleolar RNA-associated protein 13